MYKLAGGAAIISSILADYTPEFIKGVMSFHSLQDFDDRYHDAGQIVQENGLPFEAYTVTTNDGFKLGLQRIANPGKPVVFLQHGLAHSSDGWVFNSP